MIRFGIAGIPLTSKGRTFEESVEDVHGLGLNALEVQLLRVNVQERPALDYAGAMPKDIEESIIVNILRQDSAGDYRPVGIDTAIEEDDIVQELFWNMARNYNEIKEGGELARELDVELSLHAPYYMDFLDNGEMHERSVNHLKWGLMIARGMRASRVITHTGFYHGSKKESLNRAVDVYRSVSSEYSPDKGFPVIGVEVSGKTEIFGTVNEVLSLAGKVPDIQPILNFAHVHSLNGGSLIEVKDFESVIDSFSKYKKTDLYTEFSGVEYQDHNEVKLTAIKHGDLKFETLSEALADRADDITIISSSPLLEHDAQYMDIILLRTLSKKLQKRESKKEEGEESMVRSYPVKKGHKVDLDALLKIVKETATSASIKGDKIIAKLAGMKRLEIWSDGKSILCETESDPAAKNATDTIKKFNHLIESITGYSAKERKSLASKK